MNTPLPPDHDDDLPGEAELAALYRKLPKNEPGPALDAAVLRAAAQALEPANDESAVGVAPRSRGVRPPWLIGMSSAAAMLLVVGLAWRMRDMPANEAPAMSAQVSTHASTTPETSQAAAAPTRSARRSSDLASGGLVAQNHSERRPAAASLADSEAEKTTTVNERRMQALRAAPAPAMASAPTPAPAPPPPAPAEMSASMDQLAAAPNDLPSLKKADAADARDASATGRVAPQVVQTPAPVNELSQNAAAAPAQTYEPAAPLTQPMAAAPAASLPASDKPTLGELSAQDASPAQQRELDEIRRLFATHQDTEAQQRLERFHRAHPQWQLAPDLDVHLHKP
ncbi:MAG: hypothetical protein ABI870_15995 [Rhodanobacter sp.]